MTRAGPFAALDRSPRSHFKLVLFGTLLRALEMQLAGAGEAPLDRLPFLEDYLGECSAMWGGSRPEALGWIAACDAWAGDSPHLPFARIAAAGFPPLHRHLIATLALAEEDPRLAFLIEPDGGLATLGGLVALWREAAPGTDAGLVRDLALDLVEAGFVEMIDSEVHRTDRRLRLTDSILGVLSAGVPRLDNTAFEPRAALPAAEDWLGEPRPSAVAGALTAEPATLLLVRGPRHNGRKTLLRAAAREAELNVLRVSPSLFGDAPGWRLAGAVAHAANAMVVAEVEPAPGETVALPAHPVFAGPIGIAAAATGGVRAAPGMRTLCVAIPLPDAEARREHWRRAGCGGLAETLSPMTLTSGNIRRASAGAAGRARLGGREVPEADDVRIAARELRDARIDTVATALDLDREPEPLRLEARDREELDALILRCRHRERLPGGKGHGVRALFVGPSGTGKTLGARHIAAALGKDLFRVDLAATVSKYIGETEKSLERALSAAEELNIVLLLDEGDALMARRTDVGSSNDRYANLETNYLLQRIETFEGIILVTTNDADRIDPAFARRMDAVLSFRMPDEVRRREILTQELDARGVSPRLIEEVACRCTLSGGQIHNLALHARLLAMEADRPVADDDLRRAVAREYRKAGDYCPLKPPLSAVG